MDRYSLEHLADPSLLHGLHALAAVDRATTADLLAHIAEVDRRRLYAPAGYPSMRAYCVGVLHLSEDAAAKRIQVARKARRFPQVFAAIAEGRVHLSGMNLLAPFLDDENVDELIALATHRTRAEIEHLVAERYPLPDPAEEIEPAGEHAPAHVRDRSSVKPVAPDRYLVQFTIGAAERERLEYALALMSHRNPRGSIAALTGVAIELLIAELEAEKFAATDEPHASPASADPRHIPAAVQREVWERDGGACTFVGESGKRCGSNWLVEYDHIQPVARGGESTVANVRLLCRTHNQYLAERAYGAGFMEAKRGATRRRGEPEHAPAHVGSELGGVRL